MMNNIINLKMKNGINVKVDKGDIKVSQYEVKEHLEDLFLFKRKYKKSEIIKLSSICDCVFNIMFCGINKESREITFKLC